MLTITTNKDTPIWYYKDDDDEFEMYGFDEQNALETKWQKYRNGTADHYQEITCGYFANCTHKHRIDFENLMQWNVECNESRNMIRALSNKELNDNYLAISSQNVNNNKNINYPRDSYHELKRNLLREGSFGGDAVTINIPSIINEIVNNTLYVYGAEHDIPIAVAQIDNAECINNVLNKMNANHAIDMINISDLNLKVTSSMISYLIAKEKCNFILYDTSFKLLAVGKYNGLYIHKYNDYNHDINPYRYQSFVSFYSLLSSFCESSYCLQIKSLISSFNNNIRICLMYDNGTALWSPTIADKQTLKHIMQTQHKSIYIDDIDDQYDYASDSSVQSVDSMYGIECSVCYENIIIPSHCFNHKDLCDSCLLQWKQNGHDSCPKCGIAHA